jgi:hypothetical protein
MEQVDDEGNFMDVAMVDASNAALLADGTVFEEAGAATSYLRVNWTLCKLDQLPNNGRGIVIRARRTTGSLSLTYGTIVNCSGNDGIDLDIPQRASIEYSSVVVGDMAPELWGVNGMSVEACVFCRRIVI